MTVPITAAAITRDVFELNRLGKFKEDEAITSLAEFRVSKIADRHPDPVVRLLCLTESCIAERDPASYSIVTIRPLSDVFALVRYRTDPQKIAIEYKSGAVRRYTSTDREALLASLLDGVRASGNRDVCVKFSETGVFNRVGPWSQPVEEEIQVMYLKSLAYYDASSGISFDQLVSRYGMAARLKVWEGGSTGRGAHSSGRCWCARAGGGRSFIVNIDYSGPDFKNVLDSKEREMIQAALQSTALGRRARARRTRMTGLLTARARVCRAPVGLRSRLERGPGVVRARRARCHGAV